MTEEEFFNSDDSNNQSEKSKERALQSIARLKPSKEVWAVVNGLEYLTAETLEILKERAMQWFDMWPLGEPRYSRNNNYQFFIHTNQVMELLEVSECIAQDLLMVVRKTLSKDEEGYVSVKEFCHINNSMWRKCKIHSFLYSHPLIKAGLQ